MVIERARKDNLVNHFTEYYEDKKGLEQRKCSILRVAWRVPLLKTEVCGMGTLVIEKKSNNNKTPCN